MKTIILVLGLFLSLTCCQKPTTMEKKTLDIQGHRGARGLMPENTIPAFIKALELGVTTLELDLAVTKDDELLVSHEAYMNAVFVLDSLGNEIAKEDELKHNIYQMTYEQIQLYDVGSKYHKRFPNQKKIKVSKPLFSELVEAVNEYCKINNSAPVRYNIEIKSDPSSDGIYHPTPDEFSELVYDFIKQNLDLNLVNVQSFDFRILEYYYNNFPEVKLAMLVENENPIDENMDKLGFVPQIYSCDFKLLDADKVKYLQSKNMKVIPWTVNEVTDIKKVFAWGVDGIISDYPDRVLQIISN